MDINCVNKCIYQTEGKCNLSHLSSLGEFKFLANDNDCPYCLENM